MHNNNQNKTHIVLLGASVGNAWNIENLPSRINNYDYSFEYVGDYHFNKSDTLHRTLERNKNKPKIIFLKECAAYFPGNFQEYKNLMITWIEQCLKSDVIPIPTTVVPVNKPNFFTLSYFKNLMKKHYFEDKIPVEDRLQYIVEYNDWIRSYAKEIGLAVLDLERAVRISDKDRRLKPDLTSGDGLHLNDKAYSLLDKIVIPTLLKVKR